ncbi:kinesin light chain, putative [Medicago truncatula]|uniref:Kinesin light chain, putative n=1 Tax=Medicago truncatula TaxID=3880 RepID=G7KI84_MEDTR|nr:kinesin light chain, putative [Medicago truncatula]
MKTRTPKNKWLNVWILFCNEVVFSYQKVSTAFKSTKGENHPTVASVFVRLADLYNKISKFRESKTYC